MNEPTSREFSWLDERLHRLGAEPHLFDVVRSPLRPVVERADPWQADAWRHDFGALVSRLVPPSEGKAGEAGPHRGRVVAVTDVEEDPIGRVQAAVLLARRLAEAGHQVLLVDVDLRHVGLSRWMPNRDLDAEGLVDILQYGASVAAVVRRGPIGNVQILSVGSYRPDAIDLYEEEGLGRLIAQLRANADVVLMVLPAWLSTERFHPLLVHADTVVLSLHLDRTLGPLIEDLLGHLQRTGAAVAGLVAFAGPDASERHVDALLREADAGPAPELDDDLAAARPVIEPPIDEQVSGLVVPAVDHRSDPGPRGFRRGPRRDAESSSPVLRIALVIAVVVLLAFVGWWGLTQREHPRAEPAPVSRRPAAQLPTQTAGGVEPAESVPDVVADTVAAQPASLRAGSPELGAGAVAAEPDTTSAERVQTPVRPQPPATTAIAAPTPAPTPTPTPAADSVYDRELAREVGGGFALHLFSFSDSTDALSVLPRLQSQGWRPVVRGADIPEKGRWFRVLVGRFDDRATAMAARETAGRRAGVDWVGVVRVP